MTIGKRLTFTCVALLVLSAIQALIATVMFNRVKTGVYSLATDSIPGILAIDQIAIDIRDIRGSMLRHLSSSSEPEMKKVLLGLTRS